MYSYGPPHMARQKQDDQLEYTFSSYVRIWDVALKTCQRQWTIGKSGERGSGISVQAAQHDDDDDDDITWPKQFKLWKVPIVVDSVMLVGVLTCCALLHSVCDLKITQMNMLLRLLWEFMCNKFKQVHNFVEATKTICFVKDEGRVNHSTMIR